MNSSKPVTRVSSQAINCHPLSRPSPTMKILPSRGCGHVCSCASNDIKSQLKDEEGQASNSGSKSWLQKWKETSQLQASKLQDWGLAGVIAYGALNTVYYTFAFLVCWIYFADVPRGLGLAAASKAFLKVFATVWAGSQVTKLARAAGALMLAPLMDKGLEFAILRFGFKSKQKAFLAFLTLCLVLALSLFGIVIFVWR